MKIYYKHITYNFCSPWCIHCSHYLGRDWCSIFPDLRYYANKQIHPTETLDVFEL